MTAETIADIAGWTGAVVVLGAYLAMATGRLAPRWFDWANVLCCVPVAAPAVVRGAWPAVLVPMSFGVIGAVGRLRPWLEKRRAPVHTVRDPGNNHALYGLPIIESPLVPEGQAYLLNPDFRPTLELTVDRGHDDFFVRNEVKVLAEWTYPPKVVVPPGFPIGGMT